ncbi:MAG: NFACT family protein, partial [Oscillospiraceae bacterium]|nr:NFACT family protein [Oscillospiraceae bacterium]
MAFDGGFLRAEIAEIKFLETGRVQKISAPNREEVVFDIHRERDNYAITVGLNPACPRVCLVGTADYGAGKQTPFLGKLRKSLVGGRLVCIEQIGADRVAKFVFACYTDIGDAVTYELYAEWTGRSTNLILCEVKDGVPIIADALKKSDPFSDTDNAREVFPKIAYTLPPFPPKLNIWAADEEQIRNALTPFAKQKLSTSLTAALEGISPLIAREWAYNCLDSDIITENALSGNMFGSFLERLTRGNNRFCILYTDGKPKDFSYTGIAQYGTAAEVKYYNTANDTLVVFYAERTAMSLKSAKFGDLSKMLIALIDKTRRKIAARDEELREAGGFLEYKAMGDTLTANIWQITKGQTVFEDIPLDPFLTPQKNAAKYYAKYKKLKSAETALAELKTKAADELLYL